MSGSIAPLDPNISNELPPGAPGTQTEQSRTQLSNDIDDFLTLLTTQLQNQDPLEPTDTNEFTNQLIGFSQVEQQININEKLDELQFSLQSNVLQQAIGYIGLDASYDGGEFFAAGDGGATRIVYNLSDTVDSLNLEILNEDGEVVLTSVAPPTEGPQIFLWDGRNAAGELQPPGTYTVRFSPTLAPEQQPPTIDVSVTSRVTGVEARNGEVFLVLGDIAIGLAEVTGAELPITLGSAAAPVPVTPTPDGDGGDGANGDGAGDEDGTEGAGEADGTDGSADSDVADSGDGGGEDPPIEDTTG